MSGSPGEAAKLIAEADRVAIEASDSASLGSARLQSAVQIMSKGPEKEKALVEAAELLIEGGDHAKAGYAYTWAWLNAVTRDQKLKFLEKSAEEFRLGSDFSKLATALQSLQRFFNEEGDRETALRYKEQAAEFDELLYGSRRARILYYKQMHEEMLPDTLELIDELENGEDDALREELKNSARIYREELDELNEDLAAVDQAEE